MNKLQKFSEFKLDEKVKDKFKPEEYDKIKSYIDELIKKGNKDEVSREEIVKKFNIEINSVNNIFQKLNIDGSSTHTKPNPGVHPSTDWESKKFKILVK